MVVIPLVAILLLLGILIGASWFALAACLMLIVFQLSRIFSERWATCLDIERTISSTEIEIGQKVYVGLKLSNTTNYLIPWLLLEDTLPVRAISNPHQSLELSGSPARLYFLRPKQKALLTYDLVARRRGYFRLGPALLETGDLLGLNREHRIVSETNYLLVLPQIIPLNGIDVKTRRPMGDLRVTDRMIEDPTQMVGIREYQPGDALNRIHWRATARVGKLHSRVYEPTCLQGAMLLVDMHCNSNPDRNEPMRTDMAITAAASIAHALYMLNQPFGLISNASDAAERYSFEEQSGIFSDRESLRQSTQMERKNERLKPIYIAPGTGPEKFHELHRTLARLERSDGLELPALVEEMQGRLPRYLSILFLLQNVDDRVATTLGLLRRQGFAVAAVLNQHELDGAMESEARLVAERIEVFPLPNESSIPSVCRNMMANRS